MHTFSESVLVVARTTPQGVHLLGTGFVLADRGLVATTRHVVGDDDRGLCVLLPHISDLNQFQDTTNREVHCIAASVKEVDPLHDLAILEAHFFFRGPIPRLRPLDTVPVGEQLYILGYPHAPEGRRVLTYQATELGAKILLGSQGLQSKCAIINTQARPGQSGSPVFAGPTLDVVAILVGAYASGASRVLIANIDPAELHQTTHCVSAEYLQAMLR